MNDISSDDVYDMAQIGRDRDIDLIVALLVRRLVLQEREEHSLMAGYVFLKHIDLAFGLKLKYLVIENVRGLLSCPMMHRPHNKRGKGYPDLSLDD